LLQGSKIVGVAIPVIVECARKTVLLLHMQKPRFVHKKFNLKEFVKQVWSLGGYHILYIQAMESKFGRQSKRFLNQT